MLQLIVAANPRIKVEKNGDLSSKPKNEETIGRIYSYNYPSVLRGMHNLIRVLLSMFAVRLRIIGTINTGWK